MTTTIPSPDEIIDFPKDNPRLKIVNHKGLLYVVEHFYRWSIEKKRTARTEPFANRSGETLLRNECREGGCDKTLRSSLRD